MDERRGILTAITAKKVYEDKRVVLERKNKTVMVPCGIPYVFGILNDASKNRIPDAMLINAEVEFLIDEVIKIDKQNKIAILSENEEIKYDKLVIATGSLPIIPRFTNGYNLNNVFQILKDEEYLNDILIKLGNMQDIVVIGGGFVGIEFAQQLKKDGKNVTIVELAENVYGKLLIMKFVILPNKRRKKIILVLRPILE